MSLRQLPYSGEEELGRYDGREVCSGKLENNMNQICSQRVVQHLRTAKTPTILFGNKVDGERE